MFVAMARKTGASWRPRTFPEVPHLGQLSGADVEGIVGRAQRQSLLAGSAGITRERLAEAVGQFLPSTGGMEKELQEIAAILECTDREFLHAGGAGTDRRGRRAAGIAGALCGARTVTRHDLEDRWHA